MRCVDYIARFFEQHGVVHIFGYPGGMVTHLMDALHDHAETLMMHIALNEQGAGFAACGYAQYSGECAVVFATSGPGAVNLLSAICNAYCDSLPLIIITGQVNTFESKEGLAVRQRGFQETDIISMARPVTKAAYYVKDPHEVPRVLSDSYLIATTGRMGPVLIDIPMDVQKAEISEEMCPAREVESAPSLQNEVMNPRSAQVVKESLRIAKRPVVVFGAGVRQSQAAKELETFLRSTRIPAVSSMLAIDILPDYENYLGFLGAYGDRVANFVVAKADLILLVGSRADIRQVGKMREQFASGARMLRVDIDLGELEYRVHEDEVSIRADARIFLAYMDELLEGWQCPREWIEICRSIEGSLRAWSPKSMPNAFIERLSKLVPADWAITTDVGQNQVWCAQSFELKAGQRMLFSGGFGAMGYSLPAAIGAHYASGESVLCITGDGGMQMNIQELGYIGFHELPIHIVVLDNKALGMIRHFQEMYFEERYVGTTSATGYSPANFEAIASAYGIKAGSIDVADEVPAWFVSGQGPTLLHVSIDDPTYVLPKLEYGKPNQDQEPLIDRTLYDYLMSL